MEGFTIGTEAKRRWTNNIVRHSPRFLIYWRYARETELKFKRANEVQGSLKAGKIANLSACRFRSPIRLLIKDVVMPQ